MEARSHSERDGDGGGRPRADPGTLRSATQPGGHGGPGLQSSPLGLSGSADSGSREDAVPGRQLALRSHPSSELWLRPGGSRPEHAWVSGMVRAAVAWGFECLSQVVEAKVSLNEKS